MLYPTRKNTAEPVLCGIKDAMCWKIGNSVFLAKGLIKGKVVNFLITVGYGSTDLNARRFGRRRLSGS